MTETKIRRAELTDFEAIDGFDVFSGDRKLEIERGEIWVAEKETVVGYLTFDRSFYLRPFIRYICVVRAHENQGIAGKLLNFAESLAAGERIFSSTESGNLTMLHVFKKRGYRMSGVIENLQEASEIVFCKDL